MKPAKRIIILVLITQMLCLTGCWNYREVDSMSMVAGFAIDKGKEGYRYHATFEFLNLANGVMGSKLLETEGDTVFDCVRNAIGKSQKKLFFSDCKVVILSNEIASEGIAPLLDWLIRDTEPRINLNLFISKEKTAGEILQQKPITDQLASLEIWRTLTQNTASLGEAPDVQLYQAVNILSGEETSLTLPTVKLSTSNKEKVTELDGTAVFKKDRLIGYLTRDESKYFLFVTNQISGGLLVTSPENDGQNISLEIQKNQTKITPDISGGNPTFKIDTQLTANLGEDQTSKNYVDENGLEKAQSSTEKSLNERMLNIIQKVQSQFGCDIFGFGSKIHQQSPEFWNKNKSNWSETFRNLKCTVNSKVTILNTATAKDKVKVGE